MDSVGQSLYSSPSWAGATQGVLPSQPSQRIVIPTNATSSESSPTTQTTRPGGSEPTNSRPQNSVESNRASSQADSYADVSLEQRQQEQAVQQVLSQLRARDQEVRTHEQAHLSAAGQYATSGIKYSYQTGPDGQRYAVGGSVGIDTSPVAGDPEATLQKARVVQRAALAPAEPSGQDMKVAAQASQMMMQAQLEIQVQQTESAQTESNEVDNENELNSSSLDDSRAPASIQNREIPNTDETETLSQTQTVAMNADRNEFEIRMSMQPQLSDMFAISA
ncbi:putative metalloprotease CJM1_0395 family protein [Thiomicrospira pelophila]|uniref:putative metalloprotease CJM1_0395 family protein n=1 Tax=Thiomicrospira pelophila TaxID=934 RepID=UPI00068C2629|nr:putative metalloprotease CJM1_0395 family protein [Thiomicrospira pelophila]